MSVAAHLRYRFCRSWRYKSEQLSIRRLLSTESENISTARVGLPDRRYSQDGNYWVNIRKSEVEENHIVEVGIAQNLLDTQILGSVDAVTIPSLDRSVSEPSSLALHWSGLKVGSGDELYHAIWENVEDTFHVEPFLPIKVSAFSSIDFNTKYMQNPSRLDDRVWLFRIQCSAKDMKLLSHFLSSCRTQEEYDHFCSTNTTSNFETELN